MRRFTRRVVQVPLRLEPAHHLLVAEIPDPDEHRIKDRSEKLRKERRRMPVHGAELKNPDLQRLLLSGRRKRKRSR